MPDTPRPIGARDLEPARALLRTDLGGTPYLDRAMEILERAVDAADEEHRAIVAASEGALNGLALFGMIAGTVGTAEIHAMAVRPDAPASVGPALVEEVIRAMRERRASVAIAEVPDDTSLATLARTLRESGFEEESRVEDYYRDGVDLIIFRRNLA
jgi:ribosomal protein S18 acetylase RimI-like enzyme